MLARNSVHPTVKFKCERGVHFDPETRSVDFLYVTVWIDAQGYIQTILFTKPSRVVQYLLPSFCHPGHITRNIPYSLGYRLCRLESRDENLERNLQVLKEELVSRQY